MDLSTPFEIDNMFDTNTTISAPPTGNIDNQSNNTSDPFSTPSDNRTTQQQQKYRIIDFYWLINQRLQNGEKLSSDEAHICCVGFNSMYNNLRFTFYTSGNNAFTETSLNINNCKRLANFNLFPEHAIEILSNKNSGKEINIIERVYSTGNNWLPNKTVFIWKDDKVYVKTADKNGSYKYTFIGYDVIALDTSLKFCVNGQSWLVSLFDKIVNNT
jgi:hypothetical protein